MLTMKLAFKGQQAQITELLEKLPASGEAVPLKIKDLSKYELVFDLNFDDDPEHLEHYAQESDLIVVVGAVRIQLEELPAVLGAKPACTFIGFNSLPSFINRSLAELSLLSNKDESIAAKVFNALEWDYRIVESRIGMVTPRIVCMIINEAYFTVQEGTASKEDIDLGMKLGTAYPKGPFEWCEQIGVINVYEVLHALYEDTKDERYKICPALKTDYLRSMGNQ